MSFRENIIEQLEEFKKEVIEEENDLGNENYVYDRLVGLYFPLCFDVNEEEGLKEYLDENFHKPIKIHTSRFEKLCVTAHFEDNGHIGSHINVNFDNIVSIDIIEPTYDDMHYDPHGLDYKIKTFDGIGEKKWKELMKEESYNHMDTFEYQYHSHLSYELNLQSVLLLNVLQTLSHYEV